MKRLFLVIVLIYNCLVSFSQSVGIGTVSPSNNAILELSSNNKGFLLPRMTTAQRTLIPSTPGLLVYDTDLKEIYQHDGGSWRKLLNSTFWNSGSARSWVYNITDSIGIGTLSPDQKLHLLNGKFYIQDNRANQSPHIIFDNPAVNYKEGGLQWHRSGDTLASLNYVANPNTPNYIAMNVSSKAAPDIVVNASGRIGMGVTNPSVKLQIRDSDASDIVMLDALNPTIQLRRNTGGIIPVFSEVGFIQTSADNIRIGTNSGNTAGKFVIRTNGADRAFVDGEGNLSIGTTDVAAGYRVNIAGKAICEELKVQLRGSWPDYVFANDYKLLSIKEVEAFIKQNNHLPGITPAAEIEKNGIELGDMQKRMMEKIEELTLYIIDLQKQIDELKKDK